MSGTPQNPTTRLGTTHASDPPVVVAGPASRFAPGTVIAGRFRVIALLGQGGMAEVYRAEDLRLGQQVALKFLPAHVVADDGTLSRLRREVRLGRQISHPNVCRLHDLLDWDGHHFIAMEYIDGEDLASLLRRIGTLPREKALDVARDLAAGLSALHEAGVVHRDLKPANVMIDGRGRARITDFGVAELTGHLAQVREMSGTPAYMAPEQLKSGVATERSDIYSFGIILFEFSTGRRRFPATSYDDLLARHAGATAEALAEDLRQVEPALQRVIAWCLQEAPELRPPSCQAVLSLLPNHDALQAALDAGDTPSPELVAAAGGRGDLQPGPAVATLAGLFVLLAAVVWATPAVSYYGLAEATRTPAGLADRAREVLAVVDAPAPRDVAVGTRHHAGFEAVAGDVASADRWTLLRDLTPGPIEFVYRQSPDLLIPSTIDGRVTSDAPPANLPGMAEVRLDTGGRLVRFTLVPQAGSAARADATEETWRRLFDFAGLDHARRVPADAAAEGPSDARVTHSWLAPRIERGAATMRVEATSVGGRPVSFTVTDPRVPNVVPAVLPAFGGTPENPIPAPALVLRVVMLIVAAVLAVRNLRQGRGDRNGAFWTAAATAVLLAAGRVIGLDHVPSVTVEMNLIVYTALPVAIAEGAMVWLTYVAVEPYVRRFWPHALISWNRVVTGRWRDPRVGRDLLVGLAGGLVILLAARVVVIAPAVAGQPWLSPVPGSPAALGSTAEFTAVVLNRSSDALRVGVSVLSFLFLFLAATRSRRIAVSALLVFVTLGVVGRGDPLGIEMAGGLVAATTAVVLLTRFGLLSIITSILTVMVLQAVPLTFDVSAWYFGRSLFGMVLVVALGSWGFRQALAGRVVLPPLLDRV